MKVLCTHTVDVEAPAEMVFDYVSDLSRWPAWFGCVVSASQPQQAPLALGAEIVVCMNAGRRRWREDLEVTRFITNAFISFEALYSTARRIDFRFERRGRTTRIIGSIGYPVYGGLFPAAYHAAVGRRRVQQGLRDSLIHLKNVVEERAVAAGATDDLDALALAPVAKPVMRVEAQPLRVV